MIKSPINAILVIFFAPFYMLAVLVISVIRGAYEQASVDVPKEWRMVRNSWRSAVR